MVVTAKFTYTPNLPTYPTVIKKELLDKKVYVKYSEVKYPCSGQLVYINTIKTTFINNVLIPDNLQVCVLIKEKLLIDNYELFTRLYVFTG